MIKFWHEIGTILELKILEKSEIALFSLEKDNFSIKTFLDALKILGRKFQKLKFFNFWSSTVVLL